MRFTERGEKGTFWGQHLSDEGLGKLGLRVLGIGKPLCLKEQAEIIETPAQAS